MERDGSIEDVREGIYSSESTGLAFKYGNRHSIRVLLVNVGHRNTEKPAEAINRIFGSGLWVDRTFSYCIQILLFQLIFNIHSLV